MKGYLGIEEEQSRAGGRRAWRRRSTELVELSSLMREEHAVVVELREHAVVVIVAAGRSVLAGERDGRSERDGRDGFFSHDNDGARQQSLKGPSVTTASTITRTQEYSVTTASPLFFSFLVSCRQPPPVTSSTTTTGDEMMQRSGSLSNNEQEVQSNNRLCCGNFGLETWVSHTTKNYKRLYWRCKHCGQFVRWIEAEDIKKCLELKEEVCQLREQIAANDVALKELSQSVELSTVDS
ncbi:hypothetical protein Dimus_019988 [Dionaea muscipula]